jgi:class 3 adenylate cyclase
VSGDAINIAQRVASCGEAGHILLSGEATVVISRLTEWRDKLHALGTATVKHGLRVRLFSLHATDVGNDRRPRKMQRRIWRDRAL